MGAVGKGDGAGLGEQSDLGDLAPFEALGQSRAGQHADFGGGARAAQDEIDHGGIVDRWIGVRAGDERRHAARRGGGAGAGDGLAVLGAGLADEDAHVDETGREDVALAVDDPGFGGGGFARHALAERHDLAVDDERAAARLAHLGGIDEPGVEKSDGARLGHGRLD